MNNDISVTDETDEIDTNFLLEVYESWLLFTIQYKKLLDLTTPNHILSDCSFDSDSSSLSLSLSLSSRSSSDLSVSVSSDLSIISDYDENATREIGESISRIGECFDYMDFINDDDNIQELDQDDITSPTSIVSMTLSDTIINKGAAIAVAIHFINTQI